MREFLSLLGENLRFMGPEITLLVGCFLLLVLEYFKLESSKKDQEVFFAPLVFLLLSVAFLFELVLPHGGSGGVNLFDGAWKVDSLSRFLKILVLVSVALVVILNHHSSEKKARGSLFLLAGTLASFAMISAGDLLVFFLALEILNLSICFLLAYDRKEANRQKALKYMMYSALISGLTLYGFSLLYSLSGSTRLSDLTIYLTSIHRPSGLLLLALVLSFAGMASKIVLFPFHFWLSPALKETKPSLAVFLTTLPKIAGLAFLVRFTLSTYPFNTSLFFQETFYPFHWLEMLSFIGVISLTFGNLSALGQSDLKGFLGWLSLSQSGSLLIALSLFKLEGLGPLFFYLLVYLVVHVGLLSVVVVVEERLKAKEIYDYYGLGYRSPFLAIAMTIFLLSLIGLPPLAGFWAYFILLKALIHQKIYWTALVVICNIPLVLYYCLRIIKTMYATEYDEQSYPLRWDIKSLLITLLVIIVLAFPLFFSKTLALVKGIRILG